MTESVSKSVSESVCRNFYRFSKLNFSGFRPPNRLKFFSWLRVCLLYVCDNMPRARAIFNECAARRSRSTSRFGCLFVGLLVCLSPFAHEQLQSAITMASVNRIDSNFQRARASALVLLVASDVTKVV